MYYLIYIAVAIAAYYFYFRTIKLSEDNIVDSWSTLIDDAAGKKDKIFSAIRKNIEEQNPPRIVLEEKTVSAGGIMSGLSKEEGEFTKRTMLVARNTRLKGFMAYISVRDYGKRLQVSWYGTIEATGFMRFTSVVSSIHWVVTFLYLPFILVGKLMERFSRQVSPDNLNLFDQEELSAYTSIVHGASKAAVEQVMKELDQDFSKVDTKTRGFLNIS